jgi:signal transduction histidine kinase
VRTLDARPHVQDLETDDGRIRLSTTVISPTPKASYLLKWESRWQTRTRRCGGFSGCSCLSIPAGLIIAVIAGRWMAARALTPLSRLASASRSIDVTDLTRRLPVRGTGDELDNVAEAFNDTLGRLEDAVGEMKQFSAASRTSFALRSRFSAPRRNKPSRSRELLTSISRGWRTRSTSSIASRGSSIRCLMLARAEAGEIPLAKDRLDLHALCVDVVDGLEPVAQAKGVALTCSAGGRAGGARRRRVARKAAAQSSGQRDQSSRRRAGVSPSR